MNLQSDVSLFLKDSLTHRTIPIAETFTVDTIPPIQMVEKLDRNITYLLQIKDESSSWSRYSVIDLDPFISIKESHNTFAAAAPKGHT
ncbi:anthranilate synthase component I, partial [Bacillus amyloliquefaciens]|nr:anthranilate synthase component I [Bacillus amyloliquefaciens]